MADEPERLYPILDEVISKDEHNYKINADRIRFMKEKQSQLKEKLDHYKKLNKRWSIVKNVSEGTGLGLTVICGVLAVISTSGILGIPLLLILTTSSGTLTSLVTAITNKTFIQKHRKALKKKYSQTKETYDKLFLHFQKCAQDNTITLEEMEQFEKLSNNTKPVQSPNSQDSFLEQLSILLTEIQKRK